MTHFSKYDYILHFCSDMVIQQIDIYNYLYFKKNSNKKNIWIRFTRLILTYRWVGKHLVCKLHNFLLCADFKMIPLVLRTYGLSLEFSWQNTSWLASYGIVTAHMSCSVFQLVKWCLVDLRSSYRHGCCISNLLGEILFFFIGWKLECWLRRRNWRSRNLGLLLVWHTIQRSGRWPSVI